MTIQQFRNGLPLDGTYRFLVHDRDGIFAPAVDEALRSMSLQVLKTPVRAPQATAHCERFIGTARRECLASCFSGRLTIRVEADGCDASGASHTAELRRGSRN